MTTPESTAVRPPRLIGRRLLLAGVGVLGAGVALAIAGVIGGPLFLPGTWVIAAGMLVLAAAGIASIAEARGGVA
jgi:hypothetical protein